MFYANAQILYKDDDTTRNAAPVFAKDPHTIPTARMASMVSELLRRQCCNFTRVL